MFTSIELTVTNYIGLPHSLRLATFLSTGFMLPHSHILFCVATFVFTSLPTHHYHVVITIPRYSSEASFDVRTDSVAKAYAYVDDLLEKARGSMVRGGFSTRRVHVKVYRTKIAGGGEHSAGNPPPPPARSLLVFLLSFSLLVCSMLTYVCVCVCVCGGGGGGGGSFKEKRH
jgi:hypothetical protein